MLYNDYRPHQLRGILGQGNVIPVLQAQARRGAWEHSYLLAGPPGTGKTSTARIIASALVCLHKDTDGEPCGDCRDCRMVHKAAHWDVQEIDAARLGSIENVKELAYRAMYAPLSGAKVYILDECHRLSAPAWDSLLKLLEEPPPYLTVILCTTAQEKVPETVQSRCQVVGFGALSADALRAMLGQLDGGHRLPDWALGYCSEYACGDARKAWTLAGQIAASTG